MRRGRAVDGLFPRMFPLVPLANCTCLCTSRRRFLEIFLSAAFKVSTTLVHRRQNYIQKRSFRLQGLSILPCDCPPPPSTPNYMPAYSTTKHIKVMCSSLDRTINLLTL